MTAPSRRPGIRSVAMPAEHGGWGLTLEPALLGLLLAPSAAGVMLGIAALATFLFRTPLRLLLIGRRRADDRQRTSLVRERTRLATRVAAVELATIVVSLLLTAWLAADPLWWLPGLVALPLFLVALWFDARSLSRHVVPEIGGSVAVASVAAMGALAGGGMWPLALGAWLILSARIVSSIPHVRAQIRRIHGRDAPVTPGVVGDLGALLLAGCAVILDPTLLLGVIAIVGLIVVQRVTLARPPRPAKVLGIRQMILGFSVVAVTAAGASFF